MKLRTSSGLIHDGSVSLKKLQDPVMIQIANIMATGSTDGTGTAGANPSQFATVVTTIRFYDSAGVEQYSYPCTVEGYTNAIQGGFVAQYVKISQQRTPAFNLKASLRLAQYQAETGNVAIDACQNSATVWTLTITGAPTGGTFTITINGLTTAGIAYNAAAATVAAAINALTGFTAACTGTGGVLPGGTVTLTFANSGNVNILTTTDSLTGGTAPATVLAVSTWTNGTAYFLSGPIQYAGGTETDRAYLAEHGFWSGDQSALVRIRTMEATSTYRSQLVKGRLKLSRDNADAPPTGGVLSVSWIDYTGTLVDAVVPTGARAITATTGVIGTPPEVEVTGWNEPADPAYLLPALTIADSGGHTQVVITFDARQLLESSMAYTWTYAAPSNPMDHYYLNWNPQDQVPTNNDTTIALSIIDFRLLGAQVVVTGPGTFAVDFTDVDIFNRNGLLENLNTCYMDFIAVLRLQGEDCS